ncbi:MAG TPA: nucleotide exchange factor GrpE, partial [Chitinophagaceae bacterium]|nr:nucleotide exchange factor GrpE [Chitinophagaceae bacterium]
MLKKKKKEGDSDNPEVINDVINESEQPNGQDQNQQIAEDENAESGVNMLKEELSLANDKYLRLYAEFDNFRRRTIKEREEARKMEGKDLIVSLLPVLDD